MLRKALLLVLAGGLAWATPCAGQSLADVARAEEARRKTIKSPGKTYTNDTLRGEDGGPPPPPPPPVASATTPAPATGPAPAAGAKPAPAPSKPAGSGAAADSSSDEKLWRERITNARNELKRSQAFFDALTSQINGLYTEFVNMGDPAQRAVIEQKRLAAIAEQDKVKAEIAQRTKAIADIEDEARRNNIPAGWLR